MQPLMHPYCVIIVNTNMIFFMWKLNGIQDSKFEGVGNILFQEINKVYVEGVGFQIDKNFCKYFTNISEEYLDMAELLRKIVGKIRRKVLRQYCEERGKTILNWVKNAS